MDVIDVGHSYWLRCLDNPTETFQSISFVKREGDNFPGNIGHHPGTTSQEVLRALIDRAKYVNRQIPCWQTKLSIYLMGVVVWLYEHRAAKRHGRKAPTAHASIYGECCQKCGHVGCNNSH